MDWRDALSLAPQSAPSRRGPSGFAREVSGKLPQWGQPSTLQSLGGSASRGERERERAAGEGRRSSRRRAQLRGKESTQRSGRPPLTSTRLKRALSLAGSCTQGITAMGRLAGPTSQDPGRGLSQRDATGSGTQRTPVGGPGGKSARQDGDQGPPPCGAHAQSHGREEDGSLLPGEVSGSVLC